MADNDVKIKLSLDGADKVQSGLAGVGDGAGNADSKLKGLIGGGLKGAGVALAGFATAAVAAGGSLAKGVVDQYAQYEQNLGGIETLFGKSAGKMKQYAQEAYATAGLSANEYMSQATSFAAALTGSLGKGKDSAKAANDIMVAMADNANKMGTDMGSIQNAYQGFSKQNYTMLDNLKLGYGGTQAEMQRLLTDAEKLPGAMGQKFDIKNFADVTKAIQLVQANMGIAGTTAKEASTTISGSIGMLKGAFSNLLTGLGSSDADVSKLAGNVISSFQTVVKNIQPVIENIGSNIATLGPQLGTMMSSLVGTISAAIPAVLKAGTALIGGLIKGVSSALPQLITAAVPAIIGLVNMIATQLPLLIDAGMKAVIALAQGLVKAIPTLLPTITKMIVGIVNAIIANLPALLDVALQLVMALTQGLLDSIPVLIDALPQMITSLVNFLVGAIPQIVQAGISLLTGIIGALPQIITAIVAALPQIISALVTALTTMIPQLIQAGLDLFTALIGALPEIITTLVAAVPQIIVAILNALTTALPQLIQAGISLFMGLIGALPKIISGLVAALPKIITALVGAIANGLPKIVTAGYNLLVGLVSNIGGVVSKVAGAIPRVITGIVNAVGKGFNDMVKAGENLLHGLWQGISNSADWLKNKVLKWAGGLMSDVKAFFGISSPSKLWRDEIGEMLPLGLSIGIERKTDVAVRSVRDMGEDLTAAASKSLSPLTTNSMQTTAPIRVVSQPSAVSVGGSGLSTETLASAFRSVLEDRQPTQINVTTTDPYAAAVRVDQYVRGLL